jgi:hypothetical protein
MPLLTEFALHPSEETRPTVAKSAAMTRAQDNPILFCSKWVGGGIAPPSPVAAGPWATREGGDNDGRDETARNEVAQS